MALNCQLSINPAAYSAGQTPPPSLSLLVVNPNAVAVSVTGVEWQFTDQNLVVTRPPVNPPLFPFGPGQGSSIAALSSQTFGPMALAVWSAANLNPQQTVPPFGAPLQTQGSQRPQTEVWVGALVYGSDGSVNVAGRARLLVSYANAPTRGTLGGNADLTQSTNSGLIEAVL